MHVIYAGLTANPFGIRETDLNSIMSVVMLLPNVFTSPVLFAANILEHLPQEWPEAVHVAILLSTLQTWAPAHRSIRPSLQTSLHQIVLEALRTKHPHHLCPLQLSNFLWGEAKRAEKHAMKVRVSCALQHNNNITTICCAMWKKLNNTGCICTRLSRLAAIYTAACSYRCSSIHKLSQSTILLKVLALRRCPGTLVCR